jgi:hypothetical protein
MQESTENGFGLAGICPGGKQESTEYNSGLAGICPDAKQDSTESCSGLTGIGPDFEISRSHRDIPNWMELWALLCVDVCGANLKGGAEVGAEVGADTMETVC